MLEKRKNSQNFLQKFYLLEIIIAIDTIKEPYSFLLSGMNHFIHFFIASHFIINSKALEFGVFRPKIDSVNLESFGFNYFGVNGDKQHRFASFAVITFHTQLKENRIKNSTIISSCCESAEHRNIRFFRFFGKQTEYFVNTCNWYF